MEKTQQQGGDRPEGLREAETEETSAWVNAMRCLGHNTQNENTDVTTKTAVSNQSQVSHCSVRSVMPVCCASIA